MINLLSCNEYHLINLWCEKNLGLSKLTGQGRAQVWTSDQKRPLQVIIYIVFDGNKIHYNKETC